MKNISTVWTEHMIKLQNEWHFVENATEIMATCLQKAGNFLVA